MFHRRKSRDALYEQYIADLKEANELRHKESIRVIKALADEVEFLRAKHYGPATATTTGYTPATVAVKPERDFMADPDRQPLYMSEEEEDLAALRSGGFIDAVEYEQAMNQLRQAAGGVPFHIEES